LISSLFLSDARNAHRLIAPLAARRSPSAPRPL